MKRIFMGRERVERTGFSEPNRINAEATENAEEGMGCLQ
jgi:hypothetical protein